MTTENAVSTDNYTCQNNSSAIQLAELVLSMNMGTDKGLVARRLARELLGIADHGNAPPSAPVTTNGTTRLIPLDEPVFLIRGQDSVGGGTVRCWADLAEADGAGADILAAAREHAAKMDAWPKKKTADLPAGFQTEVLGAKKQAPSHSPCACRPGMFCSSSAKCAAEVRGAQAKPADLPLSAEEAETLALIDEQFGDDGETSVDYSVLMDFAMRGYLECQRFEVTAKGQDAIAHPTCS